MICRLSRYDPNDMNSVMETIVLRNSGLASAENVSLALLTTNGTAVPAWARLNASTNQGTLAVNASKNIPVSFAPTGGVSSATYRYLLRVTADNASTNDVYFDVTVDNSGNGGALFKVEDVYTGSKNNGVSGARIALYKQDGAFLGTNMTTDANGEAYFQNLPAGRYRYSVSADKHDVLSGTLWVRPGVVQSEALFLQYRAVTVEWSVTPIEIEDCYEIVLNATFETDSTDWRWHVLDPVQGAYDGPQPHWVAALQGRVPLLPTAETALATMLVSEGIYLSDRLGRDVTPDEVLDASQSTAAVV